jgi:hypothetical protein
MGIRNSRAAEPDATAEATAPTGAKIVYANDMAVLNDAVAVTYDHEAKAPAGLALVVVGRDVQQLAFAGLSAQEGYVCVGPAHPVYVAINLAHQAGATEVTVEGVPPDAPATDTDPGSAHRERLLKFLGDSPVSVSFT